MSYQVVGGLAAVAYGGTRPLNDIDLYAPLSGQSRLIDEVRECTVWGPERYRDDAVTGRAEGAIMARCRAE